MLRRVILAVLTRLPGGDALIAAVRRWRHSRLPGAVGESYIDPSLPRRTLILTILVDDPKSLPAGYDAFEIATPAAVKPVPERAYYAPPRGAALLSIAHLNNLLFCLQCTNLDLAVASATVEEPPDVAVENLRSACLFSDRAFNAVMCGDLPPRVMLSGRVLRLLPGPVEAPLRALQDVIEFGAVTLQRDGPGFTVGQGQVTPRRAWATHQPLAPTDARPVVFILPIFLAVGGVERNTIEIVRALRENYRFIVVPTERQTASQGSLHHQMADAGGEIYNLAECAGRDRHLDMLRELKAAYDPELVWVCNGSPWLAENAAALRDLFDDCPIVDQQVYDSDVGWIEYFDQSGIQSFDRFIAINRRIQEKFEHRYRIDPAKIDLIYSAIDAPRFDLPEPSPEERRRRLEEFGLPADRRIFAFIGRLTDQKRPLEFLRIASDAQQAGQSDAFLLVGDGPLRDDCDFFIDKYDLENVYKIPFCDDLTRLYPLLSGLIVTSKYEGLPIALLEALAMGVPAFSTDVGDIRLVLEDHGNGHVIDGIETGAAFLRACTDWRSDNETQKRNAAAAAADVRARFSVDNISGQFERCWQKAIAARRG